MYFRHLMNDIYWKLCLFIPCQKQSEFDAACCITVGKLNRIDLTDCPRGYRNLNTIGYLWREEFDIIIQLLN
jgi:hypothetical protein